MKKCRLVSYIAACCQCLCSFIPMSMPFAVFFPVTYAVSKMNDDAEVMATRSVGFSKEQIFLPFY